MIVPDREIREQALDAARSFIVQAPAGSGKTELLIQRFLTLLARVEEPENVVAITFTRKAAGEMRARVLKALAEAAGPRPSEEHAARTWELACATLARDRERLWQLSSNPNRLRIRTIDALCSSLARQMPWLSRLGAPLEPVEDASDLYSEAARRAIEMLRSADWAPALETLLLHLDNDFAKLRELLAGMLARRDQWLRHVGTGEATEETRAALEAALQNAIRDSVADTRSLFTEDEAWELARYAAFAATGDDGPAALPEDGDIAAWRGIRALLLTGEGEWRKSLNKNNGFPADRKEIRESCKAFIASLNGRDRLRDSIDALKFLPDPVYPEKQWAALRALLNLLPRAVALLRVLFHERGEADFAEVALAASRALGTAEEPTDLALHLDYRIQHLLVDEFQDTSVTQAELLEKLTAGWEPGDGRTLFLVGDPMQSIYRFREAEVGLFLRTADDGIGQVRLDRLQLESNFRSDAGVVGWVNDAFPNVLPEEPDPATGAIEFRASKPIKDPGLAAPVCFHPYLGRDDAAEAREVLAAVLAARERDPNAKIAILVRARSHLSAILPELRNAGLKYRAVDIDPLPEEPVIRDLTALTRALLHPADRIAWLAVLRAPWCGLPLRDLHALVDGSAAAVEDLLRDPARVARLSPDGQARLARTWAMLATALAGRGGTLRQWVEGTWLALGGPACAGGPAALDNAAAFFQAVEEIDRGRGTDLAELDGRISRLCARPDPEAGEGLQIMTIHKAKGLEFDVTIVPGLGRQTGHDPARLLLWLERPRERGVDLLLAPVHEAGAADDPTYRYLKEVEKTRQRYEGGRLLYVAATRAKRELHLFGHASVDDEGRLKLPGASSLLRRLWPVVVAKFEPLAAGLAPPPEEAEAAERAVPEIRIHRLPAAWTLPAPPPAVAHPRPAEAEAAGTEAAAFAWAGDTPRHVGTVTHALFERIANDGLEQWPPAAVETRAPAIRAALLGLGVPSAEVDEASVQVAAAVTRTLNDPRGRWILSPHSAAACEYAVSALLDTNEVRNFRIDRTFIDEDGVHWIVDYKTSSPNGGTLEQFLDKEREVYREQMEGYLRVFGLLEKRPVRAALYFPLVGGWREIGLPAASGV